MNISHPTIELTGVSKKFGSNWIFRNISARFEAGKKYAIAGPNGSGKSTLLKIVAGIITPNEGKITASVSPLGADVLVPRRGGAEGAGELYQYITFCAPYLELPDELTLIELLNFHESQRKLIITRQQFIEAVQLEPGKEIRNYSSGMKQRLKLALAFYTDTQIILLDEPTATLDQHWTDLYLKLVTELTADRLVVISSNIPAEYSFCDSVLDISAFAKQ